MQTANLNTAVSKGRTVLVRFDLKDSPLAKDDGREVAEEQSA
jgi:hypothetical protein